MWDIHFPSFQGRHINKQINLNSSHYAAFSTQELCKSQICKFYSTSFRTVYKKIPCFKKPYFQISDYE